MKCLLRTERWPNREFPEEAKTRDDDLESCLRKLFDEQLRRGGERATLIAKSNLLEVVAGHSLENSFVNEAEIVDFASAAKMARKDLSGGQFVGIAVERRQLSAWLDSS